MKNLFTYSALLFLFTLTGCNTETANSPAFAPITSSASDLFSSEASDFSDYAYDKGQQLGN
jgi:hypothetical protein